MMCLDQFSSSAQIVHDSLLSTSSVSDKIRKNLNVQIPITLCCSLYKYACMCKSEFSLCLTCLTMYQRDTLPLALQIFIIH